MRRNIAIGVDKVGKRGAKRASIGGASAVLDSGRNTSGIAGPEPDFDVGRRTLHSIPATTVVVE